MTDKDLQRRALGEAEAQEKASKDNTSFSTTIDGRDTKLLQDILKAGYIAKTAARQNIAFQYVENGELRTQKERLGHEDLIFLNLLQAIAARYAAEASR